MRVIFVLLGIFFWIPPVVASTAEEPHTWFNYLNDRFPGHASDHVALVSIGGQSITLYKNGEFVVSYPVSTAVNGVGSEAGSEKTPLGIHYIRQKIGDNATSGTVFRARQNTGKVVEPEMSPISTPYDYVTTRILWMSGLEEGFNRGPGVDSFSRYIYIHGTHEEGLIGQPASRGCIRMLNADVINLFDQMPKGSLVVVAE